MGQQTARHNQKEQNGYLVLPPLLKQRQPRPQGLLVFQYGDSRRDALMLRAGPGGAYGTELEDILI